MSSERGTICVLRALRVIRVQAVVVNQTRDSSDPDGAIYFVFDSDRILLIIACEMDIPPYRSSVHGSPRMW